MKDEKTKILVVDDESEIADTLKHFLSARGYEVTSAYSGEEALNILKHKSIDLILLDIMLHGTRGTAIAKIIKNNYPQIKIIVVTAYPEEGRKVSQAIALDGLFFKPLAVQELYDKLIGLVSAKGTSAAIQGDSTKESYVSTHPPF